MHSNVPNLESLLELLCNPDKNQNIIPNFIKILASTIIMSIIMVLLINNYESYLNYSYKFKAIYLLSIVGFVGIVYLLSCYLFGILKLKNYKTN